MLRRVGPYRLVRVIGRGGLGVVYLARREEGGPPVALKLLGRPSVETVAAMRLAREFRALSVIAHPNIVRVLDAGVHDDTAFLVMELVDGLPLRIYLARDVSPGRANVFRPVAADLSGGPQDDTFRGAPGWLAEDAEPDSVPALRLRIRQPGSGAPDAASLRMLNRPDRLLRVRHVMAQLCDGLAFVHARGLVHRDIKPSNILVRSDGLAKLVDFGLVKLTASNEHTTATGHVVGTYRYMSPEQARGARVDGRSDLYALGSVLYELLCGRPPFLRPNVAELLEAIALESPPAPSAYNPEADAALSEIAMRLLEKHPGGRYQSAEEVGRHLRQDARFEAQIR